jgi:hypothetical protein
MNKRNVKVLILLVWALIAAGALSERPWIVEGQSRSTLNSAVIHTPDVALIDKFDKAIQERFMTEPTFGRARLEPTRPVPLESAHLNYFVPKNADELTSVKSFGDEGWDVGIYLFGRRSEPKVVNGKQKDRFSIRYRVNRPVPVTTTLREDEMPNAAKLVTEIKQAFLEFQRSTADMPPTYAFDRGDWTYIARPVRAANQSCLKCHNDYVILDKLDNKKFTMRKRRVGDVNGILLYAFRRTKVIGD